jgi:hypothetical protein
MTTLNLNDLNRLQSHPETKSCVIEYIGKTLGIYEEYAVFVLRINSEIDSIISKMELGKNYYNTHLEDAITNTICLMLQQKSISAEHGRYSSGETDLSVMHGPNQWIAEAKWWNQDENALEGMRQLSTRYASGGDNACAGGVLLYNRTGNLSDKIERLKELYSKRGWEFLEINVSPCKTSSFAFITEHKNASSGLNYEVRHRALNFYHNPQDKSARSRGSSV